MGLLKWFNKKQYTSISEALSDIQKELQALQPSNTASIVWKHGSEGMSAEVRNSVVSGSGASETYTDQNHRRIQAQTYDGMHKLVLIEEKNEDKTTYKVCVCDGATYNADTHTSGRSRVEVNGVSFDLDSKIFDLEDDTYYIYAQFSAGTKSSVSYRASTDLPPNLVSDYYYYLIGRAIRGDDGSYTVIQDHRGWERNGIIVITWGVYCGF